MGLAFSNLAGDQGTIELSPQEKKEWSLLLASFGEIGKKPRSQQMVVIW